MYLLNIYDGEMEEMRISKNIKALKDHIKEIYFFAKKIEYRDKVVPYIFVFVDGINMGVIGVVEEV